MEITLKDIMAFFDMPTAQFSKEWKILSTTDKTQIKSGLSDGTLTY
jgi:hypothetical protein